MRKTTIFFLTLAAAGAMMFVGCKKDYQTVTLGVELEGSPANGKVVIDAYHNPVILDGDMVNVNGTEYPVTVNGSRYEVAVAAATGGNYYAAYPASITSGFNGTTNQAINLKRWQVYKHDNGVQDVQLPAAAVISNDGSKKLYFYNLGSLLEVQWTNTSSDAYDIIGIEVTVPGVGLYGDGTATLSGASSTMVLTDVKKNRVNLDISETNRETVAGSGTSRKYYVVLPQFSNKQVTVSIQTMKHTRATADDQKLKTVTYYTSGNVTLGRNKIVPLHVSAQPSEDNDLTGYFSVRGDGQGNDTYKVVFSRGNLQHTGNASYYNTNWKFADRQYDFFGAANMQSGNYNLSTTVDLFSWSTNNSHYGLVTYDWWNDDDDWRASETWKEWGDNVISGDPANTWFTLTSAEWYYLLHSRVNGTGDNLRGKARITGIADHPGVATLNGAHRTQIEGFIIVPDDWTEDDVPSGLSFVPASSTDTSTHNVYTVEQWARMEAAGAMFLPAAGYGTRYGDEGNEILDAFKVGQYWSQTKPRSGQAEADYLAFQYNYYYWHIMVSNESIGTHTDANYDSKFWYMRSVRLVKPAPGYTDPDGRVNQ